jgi:hypothetical protein
VVFIIDDLIVGVAAWLCAKLGIGGASCAYAAGSTSVVAFGASKASTSIGLSLTQNGIGLGVELLGTKGHGISLSLGTHGLEAGLKLTDNFSVGLSTGLFESELFRDTEPYADNIASRLRDSSTICSDCGETHYSFHVCPEKWRPKRESLDIMVPSRISGASKSSYYVDDLTQRLRTAICRNCNHLYLVSAGHSCLYETSSSVQKYGLGYGGLSELRSIAEDNSRPNSEMVSALNRIASLGADDVLYRIATNNSNPNWLMERAFNALISRGASNELRRIAEDNSNPNWLMEKALASLKSEGASSHLYKLATNNSNPNWVMESALNGLVRATDVGSLQAIAENNSNPNWLMSAALDGLAKLGAAGTLRAIARNDRNPNWLMEKAARLAY